MRQYTLASLFDGIGGFPYAASFYNITSLWASEIVPACVSVTRKHFPDMAHAGDITQLHGGKLPPVDIVTFGSPCQGLSLAGQRRGLADERSGLFMEAIRIIDEMREATHGRYPRFALFENVPGALSSAGGRDFAAVLQAFTKAKIPMPYSGRWANAGMVRGGGVDLAWCVYDAQYFGTAQRRRRLFLVCDFAGRSAGEVLFVPKSLRGYFEAGGTPRQGLAAFAESGPDTAGRAVDILNDQGGASLTVERSGLSPTLRSQTHGNLPVVAAGFDLQQITSKTNRSTLRPVQPTLCGTGQPHVVAGALCMGTGQANAGILNNQSPTLTCAHGQAPILVHPHSARALCMATGQANAEVLADIAPTLNCNHEQPLLVHPQIAGTLCASGAGLSRPAGMGSETDFCIVPAAVDCRNFRETQEISGTLQAKTASGGYSLNYQNPIRIGCYVRRLTPLECERLQGFPDFWTEQGGGRSISDTSRYQMLGNSIAVPCVAYIMQGIYHALERRN
ncbi:DNA (cytosine-5-)-methyltransferase [uncultured Oscillibacter sp.]|uniref:DNA cytosine methyltransferase n=2 Tax=uncultured Oscillibacter sp. TaxID=876091 RepID=UPI00260D9582|nr:DNA (cytosine-5-)-methyltransferase [uncultured Oscillibacter sp.]